MVKIQKIKDRTFVSIPKEYAQQAKLEKGQDCTWSFNERGNLELSGNKKMKKLDIGFLLLGLIILPSTIIFSYLVFELADNMHIETETISITKGNIQNTSVTVRHIFDNAAIFDQLNTLYKVNNCTGGTIYFCSKLTCSSSKLFS